MEKKNVLNSMNLGYHYVLRAHEVLIKMQLHGCVLDVETSMMNLTYVAPMNAFPNKLFSPCSIAIANAFGDVTLTFAAGVSLTQNLNEVLDVFSYIVAFHFS